MAHATARRGGAPGDETGGRLVAAFFLLILQELGRFFLGRAADLADHDDRLRLVVVEEHVQHVDMLGTLDRVAADADCGRLAQAHVRGLLDGFVGQRARPRHHTDRPALVDMTGHDADLAGVGGDDTGAVRADQARLAVDQRPLHAHHVEHRNALGDADDQLHLGVDRFEDRVGREGRRHIDDRGIRFGHVLGLVHRVEDRQVQMRGAAFAGRHAADHLGAVGDGLFAVEGPLRAGQALADHLGVFVDKNGHSITPSPLSRFSRRRRTGCPRRSR
eukprot:m.259179 g.259179  ORF g.259179 m.259179 type:complete len:275 (-) comp34239_c0_seq1:1149-1973(-)